MCLSVKKCIDESKKNVVCYKVLRYVGHGLFVTPFFNERISRNVISGKKSFCPRKIPECYKKYYPDKVYTGDKVGNGFIHVFKNDKDAIKTAKYFNSCLAEYHPTISYKVFECIIPKGTKYCTGMSIGYPSYASKEIKFVKKIDF